MLCYAVGSLVTVSGVLTFSSARSMEIEVVVELESIFYLEGKQDNGQMSPGTIIKRKAVDAFFTFVSIDNQGKAIPVPPLQVCPNVKECRCLHLGWGPPQILLMWQKEFST